MLIPLSRPLVAALSMLVLVSGSGAAAASTHPSVTPTLRAVPGSVLPALRGAARLAPTAAARPIDLTVSLKPRNASLLAYSARTSSGSTPMTAAQLRSLFAPSPADRAAVVAYMRGHGLRLERSGLLTLSFHGSAAAASRAFHVGLSTYRGADGHVFRAPDAAVRLPAAITPLVSSITGLDTATKLHSLATGPELTPHTAVPTACAAAAHAKSLYGGYLPGDLATAYGHRSLIQNGRDGSGESIALVEFSNFKASDITSFKSCFGLTTPVHTHPINGGSNTMSGAIEANLDIEVAMSNAPGLDQRRGLHGAQQHRPDPAHGRPDDQQRADQEHLHRQRQLGPLRGRPATVLPAGRVGRAADGGRRRPLVLRRVRRLRIQRLRATAVQRHEAGRPRPASQPFVTGVGGTTLHSANGDDSTTWRFGGGGISRNWSQPSYQSGIITPKQLRQRGQVRQPRRPLPAGADISLDANPNTGYIIECTSIASGCPSGIPWFPVGR